MLDFRKEVRSHRRAWPAAECRGKTPYHNKGAAILRIRQQKRKHRTRRDGGWSGGMVLTPYKCRFCHQWHVGATDKRDYQRRRDDD